jgi:protein-disulfide isomerase
MKKTATKKTTKPAHSTQQKEHHISPTKASDDVFVWKVGFFVLIGIAVILAFFVFGGNLSLGGNTDTDTTPNVPAVPNAPVAPSNDPEFEFLVIDDPSCVTCDISQIIDAVSSQLFTTAQVRVIDVDTPEAQNLITQYELKAVPAYLFAKEVTETSGFMQIAPVLEEKADHYAVSASAAGPVRFLEPPQAGDSPSLGDADAPVVIIEFTDYHCPFCKRHHDESFNQIKEQYIDAGLVRYVVKDFLRVTPDAAIATHCVREQMGDDGYWAMHGLLFDNQQALQPESLKQYARTVGVDGDAFDSCLDSQKYLAQVEADTAFAREYGVSGTPGFFVNSMPISGAQPFASFQAAIEAELGN